MTNFIPIFPLGIVVYPGEKLNLHIFEPRYKQLINECHQMKKPFGIPTVIENKVQDYGSLVEILEISKVHDNGEIDIKTKGERVFRILEVIKDVPDKAIDVKSTPPNAVSARRSIFVFRNSTRFNKRKSLNAFSFS